MRTELEQARRPRVVDGVTTRAVYLTTKPDPVFATAHLPSPSRTATTGVVLCPPFGWEDMCTYRTRRAWADALAGAGHPAIRIDLPGTGDSVGSARNPERLAAWAEAVGAAARWLREETSCRRIAGLGIRFGGMMAWLAAAEGAPIDDLILWAVPTRGSRLVREMRAAARLNADARSESNDFQTQASPDAVGAAADDGLLDMAGHLMTKETVDALGRLDLTKLPLAEPTRRRVLLFEGDGVAMDVRDHVENSGAEVTVIAGEGYGAMMQYARYARTPDDAIARSIAWLSQAESFAGGPPSPAAIPSGAPPRALETVRFSHAGATISETPLTIEFDSGRLFGILTEPVGVASSDVCAVMFNAGSDRRVGPSREWVETARRWAAQGVPTFRFDQPGVGDSDGSDLCFSDLGDYYHDRTTDRTIATLDELQARGMPGRFVLVGYCAGGYWSLHGALADQRVAGVFAINLPFFFWTWWSRNVLHGWWVYRLRRRNDPFFKVAALWMLKRASRALPLVRRLRHAARRAPDRVEVALNQLGDQGAEVLLLFSAGQPQYEELLEDRRIDGLNRLPNVQLKRFPGRDATFRSPSLQRYVRGELDEALARVRASDHPPAPVKLRIAART